MYRTGPFRTSVLMFALIFMALAWLPASQASTEHKPRTVSVEKSDLNEDLIVDMADLVIFSSKYVQLDWAVFDWCGFHDATLAGLGFAGSLKKSETIKDKPPAYYDKHFKLLLAYMNEHFSCDVEPIPDALLLEHYPRLLLRMAMSTNGSGDIYITDPLLGSMFIYDTGLLPKAELKGLSRPLGVAIDWKGNILIGNDGRDNIEAYDLSTGDMVATFGQGRIIMPNSITIGPEGNIFVTDSRSHRVWVFNVDYDFVGSIGSPGMADNELFFPVDTEVIEQYVDGRPIKEVFIADQGNERIQIFDIEGKLLRHIYPGECGMGNCLPPRLANLQALAVDFLGRLHALDNFEAVVSILDPLTGDYLGEYGEFGESPGFLRVPFGLVISDTGHSIVTSGDGARIEVYSPR